VIGIGSEKTVRQRNAAKYIDRVFRTKFCILKIVLSYNNKKRLEADRSGRVRRIPEEAEQG